MQNTKDNSLTAVILRAVGEYREMKTPIRGADILAALRAYRAYFYERVNDLPHREGPLPLAADRLVGRIEELFAEREELELDSVNLGPNFPTLDHLYLDAFDYLLGLPEASKDDDARQAAFFENADYSVRSYDRAWLRRERGIRCTPNDVRPLPPEYVNYAARTRTEEFDPTALENILAKIVPKYPDHPLILGLLIINAEDDTVERYARKHLRPLQEFPAGKGGFYNDDEYTAIALAHCRYWLATEQDARVYPALEDLLRFGYEGPELLTIATGLAATQVVDNSTGNDSTNPILRGGLRPEPDYPLASRLVAEVFEETMSKLTQMISALNLGDGGAFFGADPKPTARVITLPGAGEEGDTVFQLKIVLRNTKPPIWRRILVPVSMSVAELHTIIQLAFEWDNSHLHGFDAGPLHDSLVAPMAQGFMDWAESYEGMTVGALFDMAGKKVTYTYDFGDNWEHDLILEKRLSWDPHDSYPYCVTGRRAAPLEDMGGTWGFEDYLFALKDEKHEMHQQAVEILGANFDAASFDAEEINARFEQVWG